MPAPEPSPIKKRIGGTIFAVILLSLGTGMLVSPTSFSPEALDGSQVSGRRSGTLMEMLSGLVSMLGTTGTGILLCGLALLVTAVTYRSLILIDEPASEAERQS